MEKPKILERLSQLAQVDCLIRDPTFAATHAAIALKLEISARTARRLVDELRSLGAPLVSPGDGWGGWQYEGEWSLAGVVLGAIEHEGLCIEPQHYSSDDAEISLAMPRVKRRLKFSRR